MHLQYIKQYNENNSILLSNLGIQVWDFTVASFVLILSLMYCILM